MISQRDYLRSPEAQPLSDADAAAAYNALHGWRERWVTERTVADALDATAAAAISLELQALSDPANLTNLPVDEAQKQVAAEMFRQARARYLSDGIDLGSAKTRQQIDAIEALKSDGAIATFRAPLLAMAREPGFVEATPEAVAAERAAIAREDAFNARSFIGDALRNAYLVAIDTDPTDRSVARDAVLAAFDLRWPE